MEKTMTIREGFTFARDHFAELGDEKMVAFFESRLAQVEKKNSAERKPSAKQVENAGIKSAICEWMEHGVSYTASDVAKTCPACEGLTVQRVSAMLTQLVNDGALVKTVEKRKSFYSLA